MRWGLVQEEVTGTQDKGERVFWISGAMEASEKSGPWSRGGEGPHGLTRDTDEAREPCKEFVLVPEGSGRPWRGLSRRMTTADWLLSS